MSLCITSNTRPKEVKLNVRRAESILMRENEVERRFPDKRLLIRYLARRSPAFSELCEDYAEVSAGINRCLQLEEDTPAARELLVLKENLEAEILAELSQTANY